MAGGRVVKAYQTTTEVAEMLGVSRQTVLRMVQRGKVRTAQTPGGFHRIPADEVTRLLAERGVSPAPSADKRAVSLLIVDNEEEVLDIFRRALKPAGDRLEIRTASSGVDALIEIGRRVPDILILDLMMPVMDGYEVCKKIREKYQGAIRIIAISGAQEVGPDDLERCGMDAFFPKPVPLVEVLELIGRWT